MGTTGAALIISCLDVMMNFSGLFVGPLLKEFSYRKVAVAGALLCALGLALTAPAKSMAHILATYSVVNGECFTRNLKRIRNFTVVQLFDQIKIYRQFFSPLVCSITLGMTGLGRIYYLSKRRAPTLLR